MVGIFWRRGESSEATPRINAELRGSKKEI